jgi:hypothetical protein
MLSLILILSLNCSIDTSKAITPQSLPVCVENCPIGNSAQPEAK